MAGRPLVLVVLALALGVALFLYWRTSHSLQEVHKSNVRMKRELTSSREERDIVQHKLTLAHRDLEQAAQTKDELERRAQDLDEQLQEERGKLRVAQHKLELCESKKEDAEQLARDCRDQSSTLEEVADKLKAQLGACEAENRDLKTNSISLESRLAEVEAEGRRAVEEAAGLHSQITEFQHEAQDFKIQLQDCLNQADMTLLLNKDSPGPNVNRQLPQQPNQHISQFQANQNYKPNQFQAIPEN